VNEEKERRLKSDFQCNMLERPVIIPTIFSKYPNVRSGMSTKLGSTYHTSFGMNLGGDVRDEPAIDAMNQKSFFTLFGISSSELAIPLQSHSENVRKIDGPGEYEKCDALITNLKGLALVVSIADCVPILLFDPIQNAIGAVHAGWRGTANGIIKQAIQKMKWEFKTEPEDVLAFIGPSAGVCCYEVGEEVAVKFENKIVPYNKTKIFIDLKKENASQLQQQGVVQGNIEMSKHCTICEAQLFHSYRRDGKSAGRMIAVICLKD
jgi:polyphenol oxidase